MSIPSSVYVSPAAASPHAVTSGDFSDGPVAARPNFLPDLRAAIIARRFPVVVAAHTALVVMASYFACWLRFDGEIPPELTAVYLQTLPWLLAIRGLTFIPFGLYSGLWRYTSLWDLSRIVAAVFTSSVALYVLLYQPLGPAVYPRYLVVIDSLLLVSLLGGVRLLWRIVPRGVQAKRGRRVLIVGAGNAGEMIVREMARGGGYQPVGYIDDDTAKVGHSIHGVTVLGTRADLPGIIAMAKPQEVLIAIPSSKAAVVRDIVHKLEPFKLPITTLPSLTELVNGHVGIKQIRPLAIEDLLPRTQVTLNTAAAQQLVEGKRVLVTGAGGSIGAELCRQIAALGPASLILYERYENGLYAIANDLADRWPACSVHSIIGDVTDAGRVDSILAEYRPDLVFHAAAHKHVPLMEANPCEAIKNNVAGTRIVAEAARRHGVARFVLISTDKAANPSSVMGASKRVAELLVQAMGPDSKTRFVIVRFGNVLGSNGSVIPRMLDQIRDGGPVTVTHADVRRYFMLIPEAVHLVLHAAGLAADRETYVLDMGEQLKVLDVARNLIRLSGFIPDEEIKIRFIGMRPGEKLVEELVSEGEMLEPAGAEKILCVRWPDAPDPSFTDTVGALVRFAECGESDAVMEQLCRIVPTFKRGMSDAALSAPTVPIRRPVGAPGARARADVLRARTATVSK